METREGDHVDGQLAEVRVQLTGETQAGGDTRHDGGDEMVQVTVGWVVQLESPHADVVESLELLLALRLQVYRCDCTNLVVNAEGLVRVLDQLVDGEGGVVGLDDGVGDLGGWHDGEGSHHAVGELLADLGDQEGTHTSTSSTTERVGDLETLEAVAALGLATDNVEDLVNQLGTLSVMTLCPVVTSTRLAKDEVVGAEKLSKRSSADSIHGTRLQIDEDSTGNELVAGCLLMLDSRVVRSG
jgi:hypothetical protein